MSALRWHASLQDGDEMNADLPESDVLRGLAREREKLERLDAELRAQVPAEMAPVVEEVPSWYDSEIARSIGYQVGEALGEVTFSLLRNLFPTEAVVPPPTPAAIPAPVPALAPLESRREEPRVDIEGPNFVGHVEERRAPTGTEPFSVHEPRLDIDRTEKPPRPALRGPILGAEDPSNGGNYPHSGI